MYGAKAQLTFRLIDRVEQRVETEELHIFQFEGNILQSEEKKRSDYGRIFLCESHVEKNVFGNLSALRNVKLTVCVICQRPECRQVPPAIAAQTELPILSVGCRAQVEQN